MAQQTTKRGAKAAPARKTTRPAARPPERAKADKRVRAPSSAQPSGGVSVPVPTVGIRTIRLSAPRAVMSGAVHGAAGVSDAVRDRLPDRQHLMYYGGLGALAAFGALSWPAAAAIGAGVWVAEHARSGGPQAIEGEPATSRREQ